MDTPMLVQGVNVVHLFAGYRHNGQPKAMCTRRLHPELPAGDPKATRCKVCTRRYMEVLDPELGVSVPEVMGWDCGKSHDGPVAA